MADMQGKTCLVTGATSGIGRATAIGLANLGAHVLVHGRDEKRTAAIVEEIRSQSKNPAIEAVNADLSSQTEIRKLADEVQARCTRLDVLLNNAGVVYSERVLTADGIESVFAINHLAQFMLMRLLLPKLEATAEQFGEGRIVNVASFGHARGKIDFEDLQGERNFFGLKAYRQAKLANVLTTFEFARRHANSPVTTNCLCPGFVNTDIGTKHSTGLSAGVWNGIRRWMKQPTDGAATPIYVATAPELRGVTGKYFTKCKETPTKAHARDMKVAARLWEVSEQLVSGKN